MEYPVAVLNKKIQSIEFEIKHGGYGQRKIQNLHHRKYLLEKAIEKLNN